MGAIHWVIADARTGAVYGGRAGRLWRTTPAWHLPGRRPIIAAMERPTRGRVAPPPLIASLTILEIAKAERDFWRKQ